MLWFVLASATAFFSASRDLFSKFVLKEIDEYVMAWAVTFFSLPILLAALFLEGVPEIGSNYLVTLVLAGTILIVALILYMRAIRYSDLSITVPMVAFTPLFLLFTSPILVGEFPDLTGLIGVLLIVAGSYTLHIDRTSAGLLQPFKALVREKGPKLMLIVAFIWSFTANLDKIGIQNSSPVFWVTSTTLFSSPVLFSLAFFRSRENLGAARRNIKELLTIGAINGTMLICQMTALSLALVAYVISVKRMSVVIAVLFGYIFLKERNVRERLLGAAIMVVGVLLITLL
jgi:uncharacterized membrane protein